MPVRRDKVSLVDVMWPAVPCWPTATDTAAVLHELRTTFGSVPVADRDMKPHERAAWSAYAVAIADVNKRVL